MNNQNEIKFIVKDEDCDKVKNIFKDIAKYMGITPHIASYKKKEDKFCVCAKLVLDTDLDTYITFLEEKCKQENISFESEYSFARKSNIKEYRRMTSTPVELGDKLSFITLTAYTKHFKVFENYNPKGKTVIKIEPISSFGTGRHPTSQLCIKALEKYIKQDDKVLDVGCGSGILGIATLFLGADNVTAVDIDKASIKNAIHNAELNGVLDKYKAFQSNLTDKVIGKYDLIVANILTDPIKNLIKNIKKYMNSDATLILSGIADFRAEEVSEILNQNFDIIERNDKNHWTCFVVKLKIKN